MQPIHNNNSIDSVYNDNGVRVVPRWLIAEDGENRPPNQLGERDLKVLKPYEMSPISFHNLIREFKGTADELEGYFKNTPQHNYEKKEIKNPYFYSAFIKQGSKGGRYFEICQKAFKEAVEVEKVNSVVCNSFMTSAKNVRSIEELKRGFKKALELKCFDSETFNIYMKGAGVAHFDEVEKAFILALENGLIDICTANTMIDLAGKKGRFDLAYFIYAKFSKRADKYTYASIIHVLGKAERFDDAKEVFKTACQKITLNEYVVGTFMKAAFLAGKYQEVIDAYKIAPKKNRFLDDLYTKTLKELNKN